MKNYINTVLTLALLCATPCLAKGKTTNTSADAGCPVEIRVTRLDEVYGSNIEYKAFVIYRNHTNKTLIGASIGLDLMDSVGDWQSYAGDLMDDTKLKPAKTTSGHWTVLLEQTSGYRYYVKKLAFDDGTTWTDDGTKKCQFVRDNRR